MNNKFKDKQFGETASEVALRNEDNIDYLNENKLDKKDAVDGVDTIMKAIETKENIVDHNKDVKALEDKINDIPQPDLSKLATKDELDTKQDTLVSGKNIATINGNDLTKGGDIKIEGGSGSNGLGNVSFGDKTKEQSLVDFTTNVSADGNLNAGFIENENGKLDFAWKQKDGGILYAVNGIEELVKTTKQIKDVAKIANNNKARLDSTSYKALDGTTSTNSVADVLYEDIPADMQTLKKEIDNAGGSKTFEIELPYQNISNIYIENAYDKEADFKKFLASSQNLPQIIIELYSSNDTENPYNTFTVLLYPQNLNPIYNSQGDLTLYGSCPSLDGSNSVTRCSFEIQRPPIDGSKLHFAFTPDIKNYGGNISYKAKAIFVLN